ncbi:MAG TPA: ABC transporter permease [Candidatus Saccharimonadales bacterium]|nr:ABC transporter permease [Candidatus Saccharimonadales bacterium]
MSATATEPKAGFELQSDRAGTTTVRLSGQLDASSTARLWRELDTVLREHPPAALEVNAAGVEHCDGAGLALLHCLSMGGMSSPGAKATVKGLRPEFRNLFQRFSPEDYRKNLPQPPPHVGIAEHVGEATVRACRDWKEELAFLGDATNGVLANLAQPKRMRWSEVWRVFEQAGVNGLPIISLISLLVGLIIAFEAAAPFRMFGAEIFIANMIGIIMARELAGLMTGIILAGRSGSAFAAELGTMKVNEELNALETMGLSPMRFLVVQRIVAGTLLTPLLTVYSIFVSIVGGVVVMVGMGFPLITIYNQMAQTLRVQDILIGVGKAFIFGALISSVGCLRGLQTKKGPSAVGESTTSAVVSGILLIIVADAVVAVILYVLNL